MRKPIFLTLRHMRLTTVRYGMVTYVGMSCLACGDRITQYTHTDMQELTQEYYAHAEGCQAAKPGLECCGTLNAAWHYGDCPRTDVKKTTGH